jgi:hypothetical protein
MTSVVVRRRKATIIPPPHRREKIKQRIRELNSALYDDDRSPAVCDLLTDAGRLVAEGKFDLAAVCCEEAETEMRKQRFQQ